MAEYGATALIDDHLEPVLASLRWELSRRDDDGLVDSVCGDYLSPGTPGPPPEDRRFTGSLFLARALHDTARLCRRTASTDGPRGPALVAAADGLVAAVDRVFWDEPSGGYRTSAHEYRQTPNLLAVGMGFVAPERVDRVVASVVADLEARDRHHNVGHIGSRYLMPVLADHGHAQLALDVLRRDGTPGWKQWLDQGHLTFMEMWESPRSYCHYFHGTPAIWLYEGLVGLRRSAEGWQRFTVTPAAGHRRVPGAAQPGYARQGGSASTGIATEARSRSRCRPVRPPPSGCRAAPSSCQPARPAPPSPAESARRATQVRRALCSPPMNSNGARSWS